MALHDNCATPYRYRLLIESYQLEQHFQVNLLF